LKGLSKPASIAARVAATAGLALALLIGLGIIFVVFNANRGNIVVSVVLSASEALVGVFRQVVMPTDPSLRLAIEWGLTAVAYVILGRLLAKVFKS
jgi:hypothetical protein